MLLTYLFHVSCTSRELCENVRKIIKGDFGGKSTVGYVRFSGSIWELTSVEAFVLL